MPVFKRMSPAKTFALNRTPSTPHSGLNNPPMLYARLTIETIFSFI